MVTQSKLAALKQLHVLHTSPEKVQDEFFLHYPFFDPHDALQVKYEMLRHVHIDEWSIKKATALFGFCRPTFYKIEHDFHSHGLSGLLPRKTGPQEAHKLTEKAIRLIKTQRLKQAKTWWEVAQAVENELGYSLHIRTMQKALSLQEKKQPKP